MFWLDIEHRKVTGVGTIGHVWSLICLEDEDIFKMQPTRRILTIGNKKCNFSQDNYIDLNIDEFVQEDGIKH